MIDPISNKQSATKSSNRSKVFILLGMVIVIIGGILAFWLFQQDNKVDFWLGENLREELIESTLWEMDWQDIDEGEVFLSISPSGRFILTAGLNGNDLTRRYMYGGNSFGRQITHISLYEKQDDFFVLQSRIEFDAELEPEFNDTVATSDETGVAWNEDETLILISGGTIRRTSHPNLGSANLYLVDFSKDSFTRLTDYIFVSDDLQLGNGNTTITLPQWCVEHGATFVRAKWLADEIDIVLMSIEPTTREQQVLASLSYGEYGEYLIFPSAYIIQDNVVYFTNDPAMLPQLYRADLGDGNNHPTQLLGPEDIIELEHFSGVEHFSELGIAGFFDLQISLDGRWLLLTARDTRFLARDIPLADHPYFPQTNPGEAVSVRTNREWIPVHPAFLYDLETNTLVDPFVSDYLRPYVTIATAATFAPDGKSLMVATFGSGGQWTIDSFKEVTLYQICLADESFYTIQIHRGAIGDYHLLGGLPPEGLRWLENETILMSGIGGGLWPYFRVKITMPSMFEGFFEQNGD